mmetsp:Transcript_15785/g.29782  ORF Transcript_15785/g.29782 Transcript_15785/m.29782 type:complete len:366 (+) Transcript_15785:186-1283(+)
MASFGVPRSTLREAKSKLPPIRISSFLDPREPWVLVPNGSLLGFFDWVPENLRIGPWSVFALPTMLSLIVALGLSRPIEDDIDGYSAYYPALYSKLWWYNVMGFSFMCALVIYIAKYRTKGAIVTFTLLSWQINTIRHGINALGPILSDHHILLKVNHILRFPALMSASITFTIWNFILFPYIYFTKLETKEKQLYFLDFNFQFRMVQVHLCNIFYSAMNALVTGSLTGRPTFEKNQQALSPRLFDSEDLWYAAAFVVGYGMFYTLILDRIGVHIYPIFSPRSNFVVVTWLMVLLLVYGFHSAWNWIMTNYWHVVTLEYFMIFNSLIIAVCYGISCWTSKVRLSCDANAATATSESDKDSETKQS